MQPGVKTAQKDVEKDAEMTIEIMSEVRPKTSDSSHSMSDEVSDPGASSTAVPEIAFDQFMSDVTVGDDAMDVSNPMSDEREHQKVDRCDPEKVDQREPKKIKLCEPQKIDNTYRDSLLAQFRVPEIDPDAPEWKWQNMFVRNSWTT